MKVRNRSNIRSKSVHLYMLTQKGMQAKGQLSHDLLKIEVHSSTLRRVQIERLRRDSGDVVHEH